MNLIFTLTDSLLTTPKATPCVTKSSGNEQARMESPSDIPIFGCCDGAEETRILHTHQPLLCLPFQGTPWSPFLLQSTTSSLGALWGWAGNRSSAERGWQAAAREFKWKKTKIRPREDICSHFSALEMSLTNVRTAENKKSLFTGWRNYWQRDTSNEKWSCKWCFWVWRKFELLQLKNPTKILMKN